MKTTKTITVTATDIKRGKPHDIYACPVARAARRTFKCAVSVADTLEIYQDGQPSIFSRSIKLPRKAERFIKRFDESKSVKPFSFLVRELE